jgi:predicted dehydrogenase
MKFTLIGFGKHGQRWADVLGYSLKYILNSKGIFMFKKLLKINDFDAVLIATPHKYHASLTKQALNAGKHVLCEKPGGINSKEIKENIKLAKKKGLTYMIGYNYRFHDGFIKARKLFDKGKIGELLFIRATHGFGGRKGYEKEWRINKKMGGGGHLHDQGVHLIDMVKFYLGDVKKVKGIIADNYWKAGTEDNAFVLLQNKKGVIASIHSSLTQWKRKHTFEIYGTKGYLIIEGLGLRYGEPEQLILGKRTKNSDIVKERVIKCDPIANHSLEKELKAFKKGVSNAKDALETLKIVEEVYEN